MRVREKGPRIKVSTGSGDWNMSHVFQLIMGGLLFRHRLFWNDGPVKVVLPWAKFRWNQWRGSFSEFSKGLPPGWLIQELLNNPIPLPRHCSTGLRFPTRISGPPAPLSFPWIPACDQQPTLVQLHAPTSSINLGAIPSKGRMKSTSPVLIAVCGMLKSCDVGRSWAMT